MPAARWNSRVLLAVASKLLQAKRSNLSKGREAVVTTPTVRALRAELAQLREDMTKMRPDALTREEGSLLKAKIKALETLVRKMDAKNAKPS